MMEPASAVIGVISGSAAIVAASVKTVKFLTDLHDTYKRTDLIIWDLRSTCQAFEIAWTRIHDWASAQTCHQALGRTIFDQLLAYLEVSQSIFTYLQKDLGKLEKSLKTSWRLSPKSKTRVLIHEKQFSDYCDRLHRQISSLHLLLSTARLPVPSVQEAVLDLLQPVFRKDEESAWTIVKTRQSTRAPSSSIFSGSRRGSVVVEDAGADIGRRFAFENELFLGPVYKRVLMATLTTPMSKIEEEPSILVDQQTQSGGERTLAGNALRSSEEIKWTRENIMRTLGDAGFSLGVQSDLHRIKNSTNPFTLPKLSLPLASILKRHQIPPEEQHFVNAKLIFGISRGDPNTVAEALDDGADINFNPASGLPPLQQSLERSDRSEILALLMLYQETNVQFRNERGETLLHIAVQNANSGLLRRLLTNFDSLRTYDSNGRTPLHVAAADRNKGIYALKEINRIFAGKIFYPDTILDRDGKSALHVAALNDNADHAIQLLSLGCDPSFISKPICPTTQAFQRLRSPLYIAVASGYINLVRVILEACSDRLDLVNWEHSHANSLFQCARERHNPELAEILVSHGADWRKEWKEVDRILEFANSGRTPIMLLTLISQQCLPMKRSLDITVSVPRILEECSIDLAVKVLETFQQPKLENEGIQRPRIFARLSPEYSGSRFTEAVSLNDVLAKVMLKEQEQKEGKSMALIDEKFSKRDRVTDLILQAHMLHASPADLGTLGAFLYHYDNAENPMATNRNEHISKARQISPLILSGKKIAA